MSSFQNIEKLLIEIVDFLQNYVWLYDFSMIKIFSSDSIRKLPLEWKNWMESSCYDITKILTLDYDEIDCALLRTFLLTCEKYSIKSLLVSQHLDISLDAAIVFEEPFNKRFTNYVNTLSAPEVSLRNWAENVNFHRSKTLEQYMKKMSLKKQHEVQHLTEFVNMVAEITNCNKILDIGSGLGYVDLALHGKHKHKVIGVESDTKKVESAAKLQEKHHGKLCPDLKYIPWELKDDQDTLGKAREIIKDLSKSRLKCICNRDEEISNLSLDKKGVLMVGLHACADLSPIMLKVFSNSSSVSSFILMSCCYHKMKPSYPVMCQNEFEAKPISSTKICDSFSNFPLSNSLKKITGEKVFQLNTYGMRLASEESALHWKSRSKDCVMDDIRSLVYRAILQNVSDTEHLIVKKLKRHCTRKSSYISFEEYINVAFRDYDFIPINGKSTIDYNSFRYRLQHEYCDYQERIEIVGFIRAIQLSLQPVLESLLLLDRLLYVRENGVPCSGLIQLFDEIQSPRRTAIFGLRPNRPDQIN